MGAGEERQHTAAERSAQRQHTQFEHIPSASCVPQARDGSPTAAAAAGNCRQRGEHGDGGTDQRPKTLTSVAY
jgi:hypothetical protein